MTSYIKGHWQLLVLTTLVFVFWQTPVAAPLRIFVVFLHELSHAMAAFLTGGSVVEISVSAAEGGHAITRGGSRFLILSAGYLGSLLLGAALLLTALRTDLDQAVLAGCGIVMLAVTAIYIRDLFAVGFCVAGGIAMLGIARFLGHTVSDLVLRVIGLTSLIYVPYDIFDDTIARSGERSDAYMLAAEFGGPTLFWGGLWLLASLAVLLWCLRYGIGRQSNLRFDQPQP